jgi:hypothetical protein
MSETFTESRRSLGWPPIYWPLSFDNGQTRYMRSHFHERLPGCLVTFTRGKGKRVQFARCPGMGMGRRRSAKIAEDGTLTLFDKDTYTPEELVEEQQGADR